MGPSRRWSWALGDGRHVVEVELDVVLRRVSCHPPEVRPRRPVRRLERRAVLEIGIVGKVVFNTFANREEGVCRVAVRRQAQVV